MVLFLVFFGVRRRHNSLADHACHGVDHDGSLFVVQSFPDVGLRSRTVQQIQLVWHDDSSPASDVAVRAMSCGDAVARRWRASTMVRRRSKSSSDARLAAVWFAG